ncbi:MAG: Mut7-C RNAse domain-containing protein, partial [Thermoplasmata archaeon]|nr:Mut7-C RNAse domain-containing protein [Thermoplasmata archaeon]
MLPSAWWADEMLGRLARYLRIVGLDTAYVPGLDDDEILRRSSAEGRVLLTRDRALAHRTPGSALLHGVRIEDQWLEMRTRFPTLPNEPRFDRCTQCNGPLSEVPAADVPTEDPRVPDDVAGSGRPVFRCESCGHFYWEGSHT